MSVHWGQHLIFKAARFHLELEMVVSCIWIYDTVLQFHSKSYGQHDFISKKDKSIVFEILKHR